MKAEAKNNSLTKALEDVNGLVAELSKRIEHLESQPAVRKGAIFAVDRDGHEIPAGGESVEAMKNITKGINTQRLSPEEQRALLSGFGY